jgi:hypothetical protein
VQMYDCKSAKTCILFSQCGANLQLEPEYVRTSTLFDFALRYFCDNNRIEMECRLPVVEWELGSDQGPLPHRLKGTKYVKQQWQCTAILQE